MLPRQSKLVSKVYGLWFNGLMPLVYLYPLHITLHESHSMVELTLLMQLHTAAYYSYTCLDLAFLGPLYCLTALKRVYSANPLSIMDNSGKAWLIHTRILTYPTTTTTILSSQWKNLLAQLFAI